ncbi:hypothetical protein COV24_01050 [candidate division WWE3 bacterium CG10_big_fil_rev_8_21_14_0_10_32_10]|uniref:Glycosyltransferase 2-like domain-containing protein n=1 Tax=candidate division WWE3 bacterium CG10_big_fil_rev_8_21_14_0_10_32_10 TaxID=1975090 RepID=A0A2H0RB97_UNCKA|nr:MAG: hypothetical protein COV24_01050 [candidate division WWE3 bacterium CG10_big_fil_rev_8_21_14_0_10_32_10]
MRGLSVVITTDGLSWEKVDNSIDRVHNTLKSQGLEYEIIFSKSEDLLNNYKICRYSYICKLGGNLKHPPEVIPALIKELDYGLDFIILHKKNYKNRTSKILHGFEVDPYSGFQIFKKEIVERVSIKSTKPIDAMTEFFIKAKEAGYKIETISAPFLINSNIKESIKTQDKIKIFFSWIKHKFKSSEVIPFHSNDVTNKGEGFHFKGTEFVNHTLLENRESAFFRLTRVQTTGILILLAVLTFSFYTNWLLTLKVLVAILTFLYFCDLLFNLFLIIRSFSKEPEIKIKKKELKVQREWPSYTIFCPLYKEWKVLPQFVTAMNRLDYPKNKLQVLLLLEEDDTETLKRAYEFNLPSNFEIVVVPHSFPKTKPKACNFGLKKAIGEYSVIYDAEDIPDTDQLKKVVLAFEKVNSNVACIQAKLNFYNPHQNILTRIFTAEYSLWFDLVLTGLQSIEAPIPLGGTSNHFKTSKLQTLKGWDAFNVTEDCDLGIRLYKNKFKTSIVDSTTHEEANSDANNWFWQRTRWIKGYIQTYLVHMRNPYSLMNSWRDYHIATFQIIIGGKTLSMFINPFMWIITASYFIFRAEIGPFIEQLYPAPVLYMGVFSLVFGNFLYMYYYMLGCAKREYYDLIKYTFLVPLYWLAMSAAAWVALYKLLTAPHQWSKTKHGLFLENNKALLQVESVIGNNLVDKDIVKN